MAGRVEEDHPGLTWLGFGPGRSEFDARGGGGFDVVDGEIEVELFVTVIGPNGSFEVGNGADAQGVLWTGEHGVVFVRVRDRPTEDLRPEGAESRGIRRVEGDHGELRDRCRFGRRDSGSVTASIPVSNVLHLCVSHVCHCCSMDDAVDRKNPPVGSHPPDHFFGRVLKPAELLDHAHYSAVTEVTEGLRPWVQRYWSVTWDLPAGERYQTATVSEPTINLTVEYGDIIRAHTSGPGIWLTGPVTGRRFDVGLYGCGGVVGVNFHLGGTLAFANSSPAQVREKTIPAQDWFPGIEKKLQGLELLRPGEEQAADETSGSGRDRGAQLRCAAEALEAWLLSLRPRMTEGYARFRYVLSLLDDPTIISLGGLSSQCEMSERSLQRMFQDYCGVGVKRILIRARVRDAVAAIDQGWDQPFADLASRFGWFDQSHFTADFHRITGYRPGEYMSSAKRSD